jgi:tRNA(Ile)-lysidine synthase
LSRRGIGALEDPANANTAYARVRVRREILPALELTRPGIGQRFYAAAQQAAKLQARLAEEAGGVLDDRVLTRSAVAGASPVVAAELMRQLYTRAGGAEPALSRVHLESMLRLAQPGRGGRGVDLPGGLRLRIVGETMEIVRHRTTGAGSGGSSPFLHVVDCRGCDDRHAAHLHAGLMLRLGVRTPGLTMRPRGGRGTRKLQDIFVDARVPREERATWPLVFAGDRLAWVPGVAVDADLSSPVGTVGQHVSVVPSVTIKNSKIAVLESPNSPPGEPT